MTIKQTLEWFKAAIAHLADLLASEAARLWKYRQQKACIALTVL